MLHPILQATADALRAATVDLAPDDIGRRRQPDRWSVAQILDHLLRTYTSTAYILNRCVGQNKPKGRRPTLRERVAAWVVVDLGHFPTGSQAPAVALPSPSPAPTVRDDALAALAQLDGAAAAAEARFGRRTKLANHPILGPLDAGQWRRFHFVHTRHHMKQIARLSVQSSRSNYGIVITPGVIEFAPVPLCYSLHEFTARPFLTGPEATWNPRLSARTVSSNGWEPVGWVRSTWRWTPV
ncbi:MAG: DinB family protein [Acidobacteria bacterium]|nr:DinB family protein [Acidobacteriota bacterium]